MLDIVSQGRLKSVHPWLASKVISLDAAFAQQTKGDSLVVAQGVRDWKDQEAMWLVGRDAEGNVVNQGAVITDAPPGYSWHEFGLAVDLVPESLVKIKGWQPESPLWKVITGLAEKLGLVCGSCWLHKDLPHVQLTGVFGVSPDAWVRTLYLCQGGIPAVWKASGIA